MELPAAAALSSPHEHQHESHRHATRPVGDLLREWRQRRRMSQLDFAVEAEISSKHLSFLETGRSQPSREMVLHLAELLDVPLRERNSLLIAAGFAPMFKEHALSDPELQPAREAVELVLKGHEPYPAICGGSSLAAGRGERSLRITSWPAWRRRCCSHRSTCCGYLAS